MDPGRENEPEFVGGCPAAPDRLIAKSELDSKRLFASEIGKFPVSEALEASLTSWRELTVFTTGLVLTHLENYDFNAYINSAPNADPIEDRGRILGVAKEGIATIGAFLAVIPKIYHAEDEHKPGPELMDSAQRSKGFIVSWYSMHALDDLNLAKALSVKHVRRQNNDDFFNSLEFDVNWFRAHADGSIVIKEELLGQLAKLLADRRQSTGGKPFPVFGCPAARWIPSIYDLMANLADSNNLFEAAYRRRVAGGTNLKFRLAKALSIIDEPVPDGISGTRRSSQFR